MEDVTVAKPPKDEDQKKKKRVLKRVFKKDKSKGIKPKRKLNTSLSSLSTSLNRSVTSLVIKQTLQSNNRQLAMTLEKTRQELRLSNSIIMDQKGEIVDLQSQVSTYKYLAGLKPDEIEQEVKCRMERYIMDLKTHLGKIGQQLFDATTSLGDAMELCMSASRRSTSGSCRSSTMSVQSDDDGDNHHAVRPVMFQSQVLQSDPLLPNLPQRVARLDMSVIAEQSVLIDDIDDHIEELQEGIQEKGIEEEMIGNGEIDMEDMDIQDGGDTGSEENMFKGSNPAEKKNNDISNTNGKENDGNSIDRELDTTHPSVRKNKKEDSTKSEITVQKEKGKSQKSNKEKISKETQKDNTESKKDQSKETQKDSAKSKKDQSKETQKDNAESKKDQSKETQKDSAKSKKDHSKETQKDSAESKKDQSKETQKDSAESKKDRRGTFVISDVTDQTKTNKEMKDKKSDKDKSNNQNVSDVNKQKRSKNRRETYVLPENTSQNKDTENKVCEDDQKPSITKGDNAQNNKNGEQTKSKSRRGTFVVPGQEETGVEAKESNSVDAETGADKFNLPALKDRRETFVLPESILKSHDQVSSKSQNQLSSKSQEQINTKKDKDPQKSKSAGDVCSEDDKRRKTFLIPPPPADLKKGVKTDMSEIDSESTEYFNCDMEFTEVIDYSDRIVLESSKNDNTGQKSSEPTKHTKGKSEKYAEDKKVLKSNDVKSSDTKVLSTKDKNSESIDKNGKTESQSAVEFRVPKPGKIIFAASRKTFDGTRERVPTKLPQKSRSKSKVKLSKPTKTDESVKSMFDFHERTPKTLKQTTSVYDLSLNESVHGQKESFSAFRDKVQSAEQNKKHDEVDEIEQEQNDQEQHEKNEDKVQSSKQNSKIQSETEKALTNDTMKPNNKGEIIYHLPLKGCSPDLPEKSKRERSQSRGRSKSRGNRIIVVDDSAKDGPEITDKDRDDVKTDTRGRSRSRKRTVKSDDEVAESDSLPPVRRGRSRSRAITSSETTDDESGCRRGRSKSRAITDTETTDVEPDCRRGRSKSRAITSSETTDDESDCRRGRSKSRKREVNSSETTDDNDTRRGRSRSKKREIINDDDGTEDDQSCATRGRSKSRKREITGKDKTHEITDDENPRVTRGRSKSRKREVKNEAEVTKDLLTERIISQKPEATSSNQSSEDDNPPAIKITSRHRSNSGKKEETEFDSDGFVACKMIRSKSRGRSRSRKNDIIPDDDIVHRQESPLKITRSKSRGRSRSKRIDKWESEENIKDLNDKDKTTETCNKKDKDFSDQEMGAEEEKRSTSRSKVRKPSKSENGHVSESKLNNDQPASKMGTSTNEECTRLSTAKSQEQQSRLLESDDEHDKRVQTARSRTITARSKSRTRSKSSALSKPELSDDEDFQNPKKSAKKPRLESENPLDVLFKNAKKKSDCRVSSQQCSESINESITPNVLPECDVNGSVFNVICETPVRCKITNKDGKSEVSIKLTDSAKGENSTGNDFEGDYSNKKNSLISDSDIGIMGMDLKCVTKRSRSKKIDKNELFDGLESMSVQEQNKKIVGEEKESNEGSLDSLAKKTPCSEGKTKRRHDSASEYGDERTKSKKKKTENKENAGSKLSALKKRLASLGTNLKPENQEDKRQSNELVSEVGYSQETEEKSDRSSQGKGMFTPVVDNVTEAPRSRRKAANVCYKEASLNIKMRREDVLQGKKLNS